MIIIRDENRTEHDDFILNVQSLMTRHDGARVVERPDGIKVWVIGAVHE